MGENICLFNSCKKHLYRSRERGFKNEKVGSSAESKGISFGNRGIRRSGLSLAMWCCSSRSTLLKHVVHFCQLQAEISVRGTHRSSRVLASALLHHNRNIKLTADPHGKQKIVKKVECTEHGMTKIQVFPPPFLMDSQSVLLPGPERIRASGATEHPEIFVDSPDYETKTVCDALMRGLHKSSSDGCLGRRVPLGTGKYEWITYAEVAERMFLIGSGLVHLGFQKTKVGICTKTRPEFVLTMLACSCYSMVIVPLYECFGADVLTYIMQQANLEVVFCETSKMAEDLMERADKYPNLKYIILIENDEAESLKHSHINILSLKSLEELGKLNMKEPQKPKPDDLFCICYTSGTTGVPKGVKITHKNVLAAVGGVDAVLGDSVPKRGNLMCYLPCAHIYEIVNEVYCLYHGGRLGFYSGSTETLLSDIAELKPAVLPLVPKLMNLIYSAVKKKIGRNHLRRQLLQISIQQKEKKLKKGVITKTTIWDKLILSKMQRVLGGQVQMIFTSSAPAAKEVMQFFRCSMGCMVFEVYGLSEVGASAMTLLSEHDCGMVGPPLPCNHIKLASVPELSYYAEDDMGEICLKGANVFSGYYENSEATQEAFDAEGWFHTGDIGKWLPNGTLCIIDRKKHIFKLSQGEYIIPEKSENTYIQSLIVSQIYVDGDSDQGFIVGVVVPDLNVFVKWAGENGFSELTHDLKSLCQNKEVKKAVLSHLISLGRKRNLTSLHQVGNIYLSTEPFTTDNGLLTPTMKLKRSAARKYFKDVFQNLYQEGNLRKLHNL